MLVYVSGHVVNHAAKGQCPQRRQSRNQRYLNKGRDPCVSFVLMGKRTRLQLCRDFSCYVVKCQDSSIGYILPAFVPALLFHSVTQNFFPVKEHIVLKSTITTTELIFTNLICSPPCFIFHICFQVSRDKFFFQLGLWNNFLSPDSVRDSFILWM